MKDIIIKKLKEENKAHHEGNIFLSNLLIQERNEKRRIEAEFKAYSEQMEAYCDSLEQQLAKLQGNNANEAQNASNDDEPPSRKGTLYKIGEDNNPAIFDKNNMKKGKKGEAKAAELLTDAGYDVYDMSDDVEYRKKDIDFILKKDGLENTLEVKSSSSAKNGIVWIEDILNIKKNKLGWMHYCEAEYMMAVGKGVYYVYKMQEMKDYINKSKETLEAIANRTGMDPFGQASMEGIDLNYAPQKRIQDDPKFKGSKSLIYGVNMDKYAATGRLCIKKTI